MGRENGGRRRPAAERRRIKRATDVLRERLGVGEVAAFRLLQKIAMDRRVPMVAVADTVIRRGTPGLRGPMG